MGIQLLCLLSRSMQVFALIALVPLAAAVPYGAPAYGGYGPSYHKPAYGYKAPKLSCSTVDISETVDVCEPSIENSCEAVQLDIKVVVDNEQCVDIVTTVCTETTRWWIERSAPPPTSPSLRLCQPRAFKSPL